MQVISNTYQCFAYDMSHTGLDFEPQHRAYHMDILWNRKISGASELPDASGDSNKDDCFR